MTSLEMRVLAEAWAVDGNLALRDQWIMAAEVCDRLDAVLEALSPSHLRRPPRRGVEL